VAAYLTIYRHKNLKGQVQPSSVNIARYFPFLKKDERNAISKGVDFFSKQFCNFQNFEEKKFSAKNKMSLEK
jgi:hypothetical protein